MDAGADSQPEGERNPARPGLPLVFFGLYALLLTLAALSEVFGWGWFDHPFFK
ncbi:hypothetical protein LLH00_08385 [bacterium]|nr:hypothetical protein [bacterium]